MNRNLALFTTLTLLAGCGEDGSNTPSPGPTATGDVSTTQPAPTTTANPTPSSSTPVTSSSTTSSAAPSSTTTAAPSSTTTTGPGDTSSAPAQTSAPTSSSVDESSVDTTSGASDESTPGETTSSGETTADEDLTAYAEGFHELYIHDECTDDNQSDDVCAHARMHEVPFTFGGDPNTTYDVKLRIRGLFEPTSVSGGTVPYAEHPYFKVGGTVTATDYSQWQIRVTEPATTYYLNHYPATGHTIYKEDFEATIPVRGGSAVVVRVEDANDRQIDNGFVGLTDRQQTIEGVTEGVVNGQVLRLDVLDVTVSATP